jgi:hypothetical protein
MIYPNGDRYEGGFIYGLPNVTGIRVLLNGDQYEGDFVKGIPNGHGVEINPIKSLKA